MEAVRQKFLLLKDADPNSTTFNRVCVESPLSDDLLARVKMRKRRSETSESEFLTPNIPKRRKSDQSEIFSPDLFGQSGNSSAFSDNTIFENAILQKSDSPESDQEVSKQPIPNFPPKNENFGKPTTPPTAAAGARARKLYKFENSDDENEEEISNSPILESRLFQRVKVKTVPIRSPKKQKPAGHHQSPNLDVSKMVQESNLFKKDRNAKRAYNGFGASSKKQVGKLKSTNQKTNIRDFFKNTKMNS